MTVKKKASRNQRKRRRINGKTSPGTNASPLHTILQAIARFASDNPDAEEYCLNNEFEAGQLTLFMSAAADDMAKQLHEKDRALANVYRLEASKLKGRFSARTSMQYFKENEHIFHGLKLVVPDEEL